MSAAAQQRLRAAVFGLGGVAERIHVPACRRVAGVELVAGCDPAEEARRRGSGKLGLARVFPSAEELLESESPDLVLVGSPPASHYALCSLALEAGAHVLCEKPFVETVEQADRLIGLARERGRLLDVNTQYRYMEIYCRTRERIASGEFGRLFAIQCRQQMMHPPANERIEWRRKLKQSTFYEFGGHPLDLLCFFFDDLPEAISAAMPRVREEFDSDVLVEASLRFPAERIATLWLNRVTHAPERYLEMRLDCEKASIRVSLGGVARASVEWSRRAGRPVFRAGLLQGGEARVEEGGKSRSLVRQREAGYMPATAAKLSAFAERIRLGQVGTDSAEHAREVLRISLAGYESARTGETVRFERRGP